MSIDCSKCYYNCGTPHILLSLYKLEHKDKVSRCPCENESTGGSTNKSFYK